MISLIVAIANNDVIGGDNKLLWHLSEDLKRFKAITLNKTIIMGRKTFESLPGILPGRQHVIITRDKTYTVDSDKVTVVHSLDEILDKYKDSSEEAFIIGGGEIYKSMLPHCNNLYLTRVNKDYNGDTYLPIDINQWEEIYASEIKIDEKNNIPFQFINYKAK